ncbi:heme oxygenase [Deinococcus metalli]|uniref:Heme oxygenase n=1 Tax=Deinococcus metalli TaxID=1141878 RepID=A0A7W8KHF8_9DEIO|nr:biliverdin-producing heme oxygenase [Deinococcus metalli]MBB5377243.1 heme oxygenase [Deinococcus metalli]GHF47930.1 heme oxygenase [Deinococcus metalli]
MILPQLKAETRALHARAEAALDLLDPHLTPERYVDVLRGLHALYTPLCAQLGRTLAAHTALDWPARAAVKVPALSADLRDLGAVPGPPRTVPAMTDEAHAWGALYVLEGATLGGQLLRRHLAERLGTPERGLRFFGSYGEHVGARWKAFGAALTARTEASPAAFRDGVVAGASATFLLFETLAAPARVSA